MPIQILQDKWIDLLLQLPLKKSKKWLNDLLTFEKVLCTHHSIQKKNLSSHVQRKVCTYCCLLEWINLVQLFFIQAHYIFRFLNSLYFDYNAYFLTINCNFSCTNNIVKELSKCVVNMCIWVNVFVLNCLVWRRLSLDYIHGYAFFGFKEHVIHIYLHVFSNLLREHLIY